MHLGSWTGGRSFGLETRHQHATHGAGGHEAETMVCFDQTWHKGFSVQSHAGSTKIRGGIEVNVVLLSKRRNMFDQWQKPSNDVRWFPSQCTRKIAAGQIVSNCDVKMSEGSVSTWRGRRSSATRQPRRWTPSRATSWTNALKGWKRQSPGATSTMRMGSVGHSL